MIHPFQKFRRSVARNGIVPAVDCDRHAIRSRQTNKHHRSQAAPQEKQGSIKFDRINVDLIEFTAWRWLSRFAHHLLVRSCCETKVFLNLCWDIQAL